MIDVRMILIRETNKRKSGGNKIGLFYCVCGNYKETDICLVRRGVIKSCGCLQKILAVKLGKSKIKHGMTNSPEFKTWQRMKSRCYNKKSKDYPDYGGRGIKVCDRWLNSFENFYKDMGNRPSKNHSIERNDTNKDYCPENCLWATDYIQSRNKRNNIIIKYNNKEQTLIDWSIELNIPYKILHNRFHKLKWSIERCFTEKVIPQNNLIEYNSKVQNIKEWSKELGISYSALRKRLKNNIPIEIAFNTNRVRYES